MIVVSTEIYTFTFFSLVVCCCCCCWLVYMVLVMYVHTFGFVSCQSRVLIFFLALLGFIRVQAPSSEFPGGRGVSSIQYNRSLVSFSDVRTPDQCCRDSSALFSSGTVHSIESRNSMRRKWVSIRKRTVIKQYRYDDKEYRYDVMNTDTVGRFIHLVINVGGINSLSYLLVRYCL